MDKQSSQEARVPNHPIKNLLKRKPKVNPENPDEPFRIKLTRQQIAKLEHEAQTTLRWKQQMLEFEERERKKMASQKKSKLRILLRNRHRKKRLEDLYVKLHGDVSLDELRKITIEACIKAPGSYGWYESMERFIYPFRRGNCYARTNLKMLNGETYRLYDLWFLPSGRARGRKLISIIGDAFLNELLERSDTPAEERLTGNFVLEAIVHGHRRLDGVELYRLGGSRLEVTDRPDGRIVGSWRWGMRNCYHG